MANAIGTAILNFGSFPGSNEASVVVTGQSGISSTSKVDAFVMGDDTTTDHDAADHRWFDALAGLTCGTPTAAEGFPIYATSIHPLEGEYQVRWVWVD